METLIELNELGLTFLKLWSVEIEYKTCRIYSTVCSRTMTTPAVHSEDDNFIIGTGDNYDRLRRDARQLHRSVHNDTRSKAHFARFRNSALKCSMEATHKRVEQEKSLKLREYERAHAATLKRQQKYESSKVSNFPNISTKKALGKNESRDAKTAVGKVSKKEKQRSVGMEETSPESSWNRDVSSNKMDNKGRSAKRTTTKVSETERDKSWMSTQSAFDGESNRKGNSAIRTSAAPPEPSHQRQIASDVNAVIKVTFNEKKPKTKLKSTSARDKTSNSQASIPLSNSADTLSTNSDVTLDLSYLNSPTKEQRTSGYRSSQSRGGLYRAYSSRSIRVYPGDLTVRRSNSCGGDRIEKEKKKNAKIWQDFDGLLKWFSDYLGKEYQPRFVSTNNDENTQDTHTQEKKKALLPKCSMSPLYFRFGVPENGVVRLC